MTAKKPPITLPSVDALFGIPNTGESVQEISIKQLHSFRDHPFRIEPDEKLIESVREYGILSPLLALVDGKTLPVTTAVELSYLIEDQRRVLESGVIPSLAQAKQLRKEFFELTSTQKSVSFSLKTFRPYFPKEYTTEQIIERIIKLLEAESK